MADETGNLEADIQDVNNPYTWVNKIDVPLDIGTGDDGTDVVAVIDTLKGDCKDYVDPLTLGPGTHWDFSMQNPDYSQCVQYGKIIPVSVINDNPDEVTITIELN